MSQVVWLVVWYGDREASLRPYQTNGWCWCRRASGGFLLRGIGLCAFCFAGAAAPACTLLPQGVCIAPLGVRLGCRFWLCYGQRHSLSPLAVSVVCTHVMQTGSQSVGMPACAGRHVLHADVLKGLGLCRTCGDSSTLAQDAVVGFHVGGQQLVQGRLATQAFARLGATYG